MAIFVLLVSLCLTLYSIEARRCKTEKTLFYGCLRHWKYGTDYIDVNTAYLRSIHVMKDICRQGNIARVDSCVANVVSQNCGSIHRYWSGAKKKAQYICNNYNEFALEHKTCRTNSHFLSKYKQCVDENFERLSKKIMGFCQSMAILRQCVGSSLVQHCNQKAARFIMNALDMESSTEMRFRNCKKEDVFIGQNTTEPQPIDKTQKVILESFWRLRGSSDKLESNFETMPNGVQIHKTTYMYIYIAIFTSIMIFVR